MSLLITFVHDSRLKRLAGPDVELPGRRPHAEVAARHARCCALLFPVAEDLGTVSLGATAAWRPVVEYGDDGTLDTVVPPGGGEAPLRRLESAIDAFGAKALRTRGERFDCPRFKVRIDTYLLDCVGGARRH